MCMRVILICECGRGLKKEVEGRGGWVNDCVRMEVSQCCSLSIHCEGKEGRVGHRHRSQLHILTTVIYPFIFDRFLQLIWSYLYTPESRIKDLGWRTHFGLLIKMFSVHLLAYYFSKLQEDPTKKVGSLVMENKPLKPLMLIFKNINENIIEANEKFLNLHQRKWFSCSRLTSCWFVDMSWHFITCQRTIRLFHVSFMF